MYPDHYGKFFLRGLTRGAARQATACDTAIANAAATAIATAPATATSAATAVATATVTTGTGTGTSSLAVANKLGRAYGFSVDNAYVSDAETGRAFFLAACVETNANGVVNDDAYEYEEVADPFMENLAETVAKWLWTSRSSG